MSATFDPSVSKIAAPVGNVYSNGTTMAAQPSTEAESGTASELQPFKVTISEEALRKAGLLKDDPKSKELGAKKEESKTDSTEKSDSSKMSAQDTRRLEYLKSRDREVRTHEQAHVVAGGSLVRGGATFGYATGPDGRLYAVSGEVSIDSSAVDNDPKATISKMSRVIAAALAPAQPSGQDRAVASSATKTQFEAQQELSQQTLKKLQGDGTEETDGTQPKKEGGQKDPPEKGSGTKEASPSYLPEKPATKHINVQA